MKRCADQLGVLVAVVLLLPTIAACAPAAPAAPTAAAAPTPPPTMGPLPSVLGQATPVASPAAKPDATQGARRGGTFTDAETSDAVSFHPYMTTDTASSGYQGLIYGGDLWKYDPDTLQPKAEAATSWTISPDKLTYTFKLRPDLKWSDGTPLTSADYQYAFDMASKPENKYPYISNLELIESYTTPDPLTIVVRMNEAIVVGLEAGNAVTPLPKHIWEKLDWSDPTKNPQIMSPTVSSGPYKLKEWRKDDRAVFEANDQFYGGRPNIDTYIVRIVPSQEIAWQMLKSGEVDMTPITPDQYAEAKAEPSLEMHEWWPARAAWSYLGFNLRRPALQDIKVRRALAHAIDRVAIAEKIQNGLGRPNHSPFPETSWVHNPNAPKYDFDPAKSRQLLDEAGWTPGPGGVRQKDGQPFKLKLIFGPNTNKVRERVATVTQQWFKDVGIEAEIQSYEWGAYLSTLKTEPYDYDIFVGAWSATIEPHWMNQIWREDAIPSLNSVAYVNKQVETLFDQASTEFDVDKRKQLYQEIQRLIGEDAPYIFTTFSKSYQPINKRIGGVRVTALGLNDIEEWFVK